MNLIAGKKISFQVKYYEEVNVAQCTLQWEVLPFFSLRTIPASAYTTLVPESEAENERNMKSEL